MFWRCFYHGLLAASASLSQRKGNTMTLVYLRLNHPLTPTFLGGILTLEVHHAALPCKNLWQPT
jgi:hypothetical protein